MAITAPPEKTNATNEPEMEEGNPPDHFKALLLGILLLAGAVVLLIFGYLTVTYRRGGMIPHGLMLIQQIQLEHRGSHVPAAPWGTWAGLTC